MQREDPLVKTMPAYPLESSDDLDNAVYGFTDADDEGPDEAGAQVLRVPMRPRNPKGFGLRLWYRGTRRGYHDKKVNRGR